MILIISRFESGRSTKLVWRNDMKMKELNLETDKGFWKRLWYLIKFPFTYLIKGEVEL